MLSGAVRLGTLNPHRADPAPVGGGDMSAFVWMGLRGAIF
jgi:hypothetical protein